MTTEKDLKPNKSLDSNNPKEYNTRQSSKMNKIVWIIGIILFLLLLILYFLPRLNVHPIPSHLVLQRGQLHSIETALDLFNANCDGYPPSDALDPVEKPYCGAMKLCEAMMGQDLMGFHPDSTFRSDGSGGVTQCYPDANSVSPAAYRDSLRSRKGPYLPLENAMPYSLADLYGNGNTGPFGQKHFVLCDVFKRVEHRRIGKRVGMPILYYKADTSKTAHDVNNPNNPENIYNYKDNHALLALGVPGKPGQKHPLFEDPKIFYEMTRDHKSGELSRPNRADTYILLSAGYDGLYGTEDDIANFDMEWKRK